MGVSNTIGIKSIQRGTSALATGVTTGTITISSVDMTKAHASLTGVACDVFVELRLTAATTLTWKTKAATTASNSIAWEVVEWY